MKTTPTKRSLARFEYFSKCDDVLRHLPTELDPEGYSAAECFHVHETFGKSIPCREPVLLDRALNGKEQHGLDVTHIAEDYIDRLIFACEIRSNYPEWVQKDIFGRAGQLAEKAHGYVPRFVATGTDFTTIILQPA